MLLRLILKSLLLPSLTYYFGFGKRWTKTDRQTEGKKTTTTKSNNSNNSKVSKGSKETV